MIERGKSWENVVRRVCAGSVEEDGWWLSRYPLQRRGKTSQGRGIAGESRFVQRCTETCEQAKCASCVLYYCTRAVSGSFRDALASAASMQKRRESLESLRKRRAVK